jgi:hypothetical protein
MKRYQSKKTVVAVCTSNDTFRRLGDCWFSLSQENLLRFAIEFYKADGDNCLGDVDEIQLKFIQYMNGIAESGYMKLNNL